MNPGIQKTILFTVFLVFKFSFLDAQSISEEKNGGLKNKPYYAGLNISTIGLGVTLTGIISNRFDTRFGGSYLTKTYDVHKLSKDLKGDAKLSVGAIGGYLDFYLLRFLYLTGGISYNLTSVDVVAQDAKSVNVGDIVLEPKDIGILNARITPGLRIEPYWGMGMNFRRAKKLNFGFEFGLFLIGPPKVKLEASGMLEPSAGKEQEQIIEKNISPLIYYPNVSFRVSYRIN
jgi:hypothetical protein